MNKHNQISKARPVGGIAAIATLDVVQATLEQLATRAKVCQA
jgi:hypothetical protein